MNQPSTTTLLILPTIVLMLVTAWFFHFAPRFDVTNDSLLQNSDLKDDFAAWQLLPRDHTDHSHPLQLVRDGTGIRAITQSFAAQGHNWLRTMVTAHGSISTEQQRDEIVGRVDWYGRSSPDDKFVWFANVGYITASSVQQQIHQIVVVPVGLTQVQIEVESVSSAVSFSPLQVVVQGVTEKTYRPIVQTVLLALWCCIGFVTLVLLWQNRQHHILVSGVVVLGLLLVIPEPMKVALQSVFTVNDVSLDHLVLFFLLGLALFHRSRQGWLAAATLALAAELLQNFVGHRDVLLTDALANLAGLAAALAVCEGYRWLKVSWR